MLYTNSFLQDFHDPTSVFSSQNPVTNGFEFDNSTSPSSGTSSSGESSEVTRFSDSILRHISDILMDEEDDLESKPCMLQDCLRLQAAERSFYDVLGHSYPSSPHQNESINNADPDGNYGYTSSSGSNSSCTTDNSFESESINILGEFDSSFLQLQTPLVDSFHEDSRITNAYITKQDLTNDYSLMRPFYIRLPYPSHPNRTNDLRWTPTLLL